MKPSSSRDKYSLNQPPQNKSAKTASTKPLNTLQTNNYNMTPLGKKSDINKTLPPKPVSKTQFNVEVNMTQSKVFQAKQGLQLLKKKMNRTGMSRQKNYSQNQKTTAFLKKQANPNHTNSKKQIYQKPIQNQRDVPEPNISSITQNNIKNNSKIINRPVSKIQKGQILNQHDQMPISGNANFLQLLEREMQKQNKNPQISQKGKSALGKGRFTEENKEIILQQCSKGCGRLFNPDAITKHEKICRKVFQSKRKQFNSAVHRKIDTENYQPTLSKIDQKKKKKKNQIPKWKIESANLRAGIKLGKKQALTKQQEQLANKTEQAYVPCQFCGRKFNQQVALRHIPFCQQKSKQLKNSFAKKR